MADTGTAPAAQDPDTLVSEIEQTRDNLARTIDAIAARVSPANNVRLARERVREQVGKLREQASHIDVRYAAVAGAVLVAGATVFVLLRRRRR